MSNKSGKISPIKQEMSQGGLQTMQKSLAGKGFSRVPGTGVYKSPYKELDGKYRTGLDPDAAYIRRIQDPIERKAEVERVTRLKEKLETALSLDLGPRSKFWDITLAKDPSDTSHVQHVKLLDSDNYYDFESP